MLLTSGAAEAFVLLARVLRPAHAVVVHPGFTEPEAALRAAGHEVDRLVLAPPYVLDLADVPDSADLVVVGNPTNPTGVVHEDLAALCREGRTVVVDEAFADAVPGEPHSLAARADLPGLVVVRSLTKTWALAGLRVGYLLAPAPLRRGAAGRAAPVGRVDAGPRRAGDLPRARSGEDGRARRPARRGGARAAGQPRSRRSASRSRPAAARRTCCAASRAVPTCASGCASSASRCAAATRSPG